MALRHCWIDLKARLIVRVTKGPYLRPRAQAWFSTGDWIDPPIAIGMDRCVARPLPPLQFAAVHDGPLTRPKKFD